MKALVSKLAIIWRLAVPYFRSEDRKAGLILLVAVVAIQLSLVAIDVMINQWRNRFFQALQDYNWNSFVTELLIFFVLAGVFVLLAVYQLYLTQWLQIRWRRWMTERYLDSWLTGANHYRMQLLGDAADNPDQRISEDIKMFIENGLSLALGVLKSVVSFFSFVVILWGLSAEAPFTLFGINFAIPGYLVWAALIYSAIGTVITHWIGRALVGLNFTQQRYEADLRYNLVRTRENAEQIALLEGERAEQHSLLARFGRVMGNWMLLMKRTKKLSYFSYSYSQASVVFPYAMAGPAYFAKTMQLGGLMQTASAFNSVQDALSFFIDAGNYRQLAEWLAVVDRLDGFERAVAAGRAAAVTPPVVTLQPSPDGSAIELANVEVTLPGGRPLVGAERIVLRKGEAVLFNGPSGAGKSTLFRAIAGIWPFGSGVVTVPKGARVMTLPQRPYFPVGTLAAVIAYPAEPTAFSREQLTETLEAVGLPALAPRLDEEAHWNRMLSLGEQQRLGIARAVLDKPDYLFLDEATASLDEPAEAKLYRLLQERLPNAAIISIGHRSTLDAFHRKRFTLEPDATHHRVREAAIAPAAE